MTSSPTSQEQTSKDPAVSKEFSRHIGSYFASLDKEIAVLYGIAKSARAKGYDPVADVEIPLVTNMAERVEGLISTIAPQIIGSGVSGRIKELEEQYGSLDWRISLVIALEIAQEKFCKFRDVKEAIEIGIRVGFAYLTMGTVASPLEGFVELQFGKRADNGKEYFVINYSGPVRSAGGTGASVSVIIADYVRLNLGYAPYDPSEQEVRRVATELHDYHERITNLQYLPSVEEIEFLIQHIPVQISGDPSEDIEVSNYKDLPRIPTNNIRNGVCLVVGEGIAQKAPKLWKQLSKWGSSFGLDHWNFLGAFVDLQKKIKAKGKAASKDSSVFVLSPDYTFINDLVAGRPVLAYPLAPGGFRLRYGRSRTSGYSACSLHPATMVLLDDYIALGTQLKMERPGKAASITSCDTIEGPIVRLKDGSVVLVKSERQARELRNQVVKILYLGDILVSYGDFFNRAHTLVTPGYCPEFWVQEFERAARERLLPGTKPVFPSMAQDFLHAVSDDAGCDMVDLERLWTDVFHAAPRFALALTLSRRYAIPLHPEFVFHWKRLTSQDVVSLLRYLEVAEVVWEDKRCVKIIFPLPSHNKDILELIGIPHKVVGSQSVVIESDYAEAFLLSLGLLDRFDIADAVTKALEHAQAAPDGLVMVNLLCSVMLRDKSGVFIGARMGRPEKGKLRELTGSPHGLFPVGNEGGRLRSVQSAMQAGVVSSDFSMYYCNACAKNVVLPRCPFCDVPAVKKYLCAVCGVKDVPVCSAHGPCVSFQPATVDIAAYAKAILSRLGGMSMPELVKGVHGTSNKEHVPEHLAKAFLRAKHGVYVNKDGTIRYDMTQLPITHFKPSEIGTSIEVLRRLGYQHDIAGRPLEDDNQVLELLPQDIILPRCEGSQDEGAHIALLKVSRFIDDMLVSLYGLKPYYGYASSKDIPGMLVMALAPHTSAGIVCRVIGFSRMQGLLASPMIHAATRRDCDGDEACVVVLLDALLNFSRKFLPAHRGSTQDAPLVLTGRLVSTEIDDMVFDLDVADHYPLEFYLACLSNKKPWEVPVGQLKERLNSAGQYEGFMFTHGTDDINAGVQCSAYKLLPSMQEKLQGQMILAQRIAAVDEHDVARLVIEKHYLKDIKGNLRKFSTQDFRCVDCNEIFRRPPLLGKCVKCGGKLLFTVAQGSVLKYVEQCMDLTRKYSLPSYLVQTLELTQDRIDGVFGREKELQKGLAHWA